MDKEDVMILDQLWYGNHLEPRELSRAEYLVGTLNSLLKNRLSKSDTRIGILKRKTRKSD